MASLSTPTRGGLSFISANPVTAAFDRESKRLATERKADTERAVDAATRGALARVYAPQPRQQPAAAPTPAESTPPAAEGASPPRRPFIRGSVRVYWMLNTNSCSKAWLPRHW